MPSHRQEFSQPYDPPEIVVGRFSTSSPDLAQKWQDTTLGLAFQLISDRYWVFPREKREIVDAISTLMLGVINTNALGEFGTSAINTHIGDGYVSSSITCLGIIARPRTSLKDHPEALTTRLIMATNEQLAAVGAPIQLPVGIEQPQINAQRPQL